MEVVVIAILHKNPADLTLDETLAIMQRTYDIIEYLQKTGHNPVLDDTTAETLKVLFRCRNMIRISVVLLRLVHRYIDNIVREADEPHRDIEDPLSVPISELPLKMLGDVISYTGTAIRHLDDKINLREPRLLIGFANMLRETLRYNELLPVTKLALISLIEYLREEIPKIIREDQFIFALLKTVALHFLSDDNENKGESNG